MKKLVPAGAVLIPDTATLAYKGIIFDVYHWPQVMYDGTTVTFEMLKRHDTVKVIGVVDDKLVIVDEDQPHGGSRLCFPGGRVDPSDSSVLAAAKREMKEETGYSFTSWRLIAVEQPQTKLEWFVYYFIASQVASHGAIAPDNGEKLQPRLASFEAVRSLVLAAEGSFLTAQSFFTQAADLSALLALGEYQGRLIERS